MSLCRLLLFYFSIIIIFGILQVIVLYLDFRHEFPLSSILELKYFKHNTF